MVLCANRHFVAKEPSSLWVQTKILLYLQLEILEYLIFNYFISPRHQWRD